jgi:copper homeostasis protein
MNKLLEIACFNLESAIIAEAAGADRIEFCVDYKEGGLTPPKELILEVSRKLQIPVMVIIRPRGGDFVYNSSELKQIKESVLFCKENSLGGIVFGVLNHDSEIDEPVCKEIIALAKPMKTTFHRAIDRCKDMVGAIQKLADLGCDGILSSGGKRNAVEGTDVLFQLQQQFGSAISIMPGGGIRSSNISEVVRKTTCNEFHSAAIISDDDIADIREIKALKSILLHS